MQITEEILQFNIIQNEISELCKTELGKEMAHELKPFPTKEKTLNELKTLDEMFYITQRYGALPIAFSINALPLIEHARKGGILTIRDLDMIAEDVLTSMALSKFLKKVDFKSENIKKLSSGFIDLTNLEKEIHRVITKSQTIDDKASKELSDIRKKITANERKLQSFIFQIVNKYKNNLSDDSYTLRDGHYVLPVKTSDKSKVKGIIHDISDSGYTTFIEPSEIVELNNEIIYLHLAEQEEIKKLLKMLTNLVVIEEESIMNNNRIIGYFDFVMAKASYGNNNDAIIPEFNEDGIISFSHAAHPLINKNKVVRNSFYFDKDKRIIIISGPNAGGKTVALKTVGMLVYMYKCGLALPIRSGTISYINNIYLDIGDSQSIEDNLSTFSAHITNVGQIVEKAKKDDLILIDELGTGTDPLEGEAIAISVVKHIIERKSYALISSHFSRLKEFAFTSKDIENASMLFDEEKLLPTYIYKQGVPGQSYALDVAKRYHLKDSIIAQAKEYLESVKSSDVNELMNELHRAALENEMSKKEIDRMKAELDKERKSFEAEKNLLKEKREKLLTSVNDEKAQILADAKEKVNEILSLMNKPNIKQHEIIEAKKALDDLQYRESTIDYNEKINVGDYISVPSLNIRGKVTRFQGKKAYIDSDSGMSFQVDVKKLHKIDEPQQRKVFKSNIDNKIASMSVPMECNVIGYHVDEAIEEVSKYLDKCRIKGFESVRIIHGLGSGALRKAVSEYLKKCNFVKSFRSGNEYEGGMGATVVTLK